MATVGTIELNIMTVFGLSVQIDVPKNLSMTVGELKQKIAQSKIGSKAEKQIIYFNNKQIFNNQTLKGALAASRSKIRSGLISFCQFQKFV